MAFGNESFRVSVWEALPRTEKEVTIVGPALTIEDEEAIRKAGGMEMLARKNRVLSIYRELQVELAMLTDDLKKKSADNPLAEKVMPLVEDVVETLKI